MTLIFDLLVIAFLLSVSYFCIDWGRYQLRLVHQGWCTGWKVFFAYTLAIWAILLGLYNLFYGLMKVWFTIEGYIT